MLKYFIRRCLSILPVLLVVSILVFLFVHLLPGDPARIMAGPDADEATINRVRTELGLDKSLPEQYLNYMGRLFRGDLGKSLRSKLPVAQEIALRFPPTLYLALASMVWSILFGVLFGAYAAMHRGKWQDYTAMLVAVSGISMPQFWLGLLLMQLFAVHLGWLPVTGFTGKFKELILPSLTLGATVAAIIARFTLSSFLDVLQEEYINTARAKGLSERVVMWKHAFRNALIPVVTMVGLQFGFLLGGSVVVETVFAWPGLGRFMIESVSVRDYPVLQALLLLYSFQFVVINLLIDMLYAVINPEIRYK
ncbi:MAG: ABC transporter permease subunit [Spirochaetia bacterium]|jgi:glutathione transport system permease protein|uniref:Glutathione transport system permease protein GsiC n=1 Tax=uncultured spirochete TaxID=156406 RepID=A0A3P3XIF4_9SPIR|nr:ABC transporter permease subunit [Rectinema subterraneum]MDQ7795939.1 ABC transporter permease subunit [Spirochaetia bacterium]SLM12800.1 putative peptide transporter permease subunit: membrane component of ABC superfamily [uncultured spirochete]